MMNAHTGQWMSLSEHIRQSVHKILWTLRGTRLMRRWFGSLLPELVDAPTDHYRLAQLRAATVLALVRQEPRLVIQKVTFDVAEGRVSIRIEGNSNGQVLTISEHIAEASNG